LATASFSCIPTTFSLSFVGRQGKAVGCKLSNRKKSGTGDLVTLPSCSCYYAHCKAKTYYA